MLKGKRILLVVAGGIAAFKSLELIRRLRERGAAVRCVLTDAGAKFVTPLSLQALSEDRVYSDMFSLTDESEMGHIQLSRDADLLVVAPATANILARMASGLADDLASTVLLATDADWIHEEVDAALSGPDLEVFRVRRGVDVVPAMLELEPDLVVLDLQIGNMGGMATCMAIRHDEGSAMGGLVTVRNHGRRSLRLPIGSVLARIHSFSTSTSMLPVTRSADSRSWRPNRSRVRLTACRLSGIPDW